MNQRDLKALAVYYENLAKTKEAEARRDRKYAAELRAQALEMAEFTADWNGMGK